MADHQTVSSTCWLAWTLMARGARQVAEDRQLRCLFVADCVEKVFSCDA
jgi:hypothetical protein